MIHANAYHLRSEDHLCLVLLKISIAQEVCHCHLKPCNINTGLRNITGELEKTSSTGLNQLRVLFLTLPYLEILEGNGIEVECLSRECWSCTEIALKLWQLIHQAEIVV